MNLKKIGKVFRSKFVGGPRLIKKEFTGPRSHKGGETLLCTVLELLCLVYAVWIVVPILAQGLWKDKITKRMEFCGK
jgi:hypothetical protein